MPAVGPGAIGFVPGQFDPPGLLPPAAFAGLAPWQQGVNNAVGGLGLPPFFTDKTIGQQLLGDAANPSPWLLGAAGVALLAVGAWAILAGGPSITVQPGGSKED